MKLILTQEVDGLGGPGDVVDVKDGYGRNYLVPQGFGIRWTRGGQKTIDSIKAASNARAVRDSSHANDLKAKLEGNAVPVKVKAGTSGRLFGAITASVLADAMSEAAGESIDKRSIVARTSIKDLGTHQVTVKLHEEVSAAVTVNVIPA